MANWTKTMETPNQVEWKNGKHMDIIVHGKDGKWIVTRDFLFSERPRQNREEAIKRAVEIMGRNN